MDFYTIVIIIAFPGYFYLLMFLHIFYMRKHGLKRGKKEVAGYYQDKDTQINLLMHLMIELGKEKNWFYRNFLEIYDGLIGIVYEIYLVNKNDNLIRSSALEVFNVSILPGKINFAFHLVEKRLLPEFNESLFLKNTKVHASNSKTIEQSMIILLSTMGRRGSKRAVTILYKYAIYRYQLHKTSNDILLRQAVTGLTLASSINFEAEKLLLELVKLHHENKFHCTELL